MKENKIHKFVGDQLSRWPLACDNFRALKNVQVREVEVGGLKVKLQFNPARMVSSAAKLTKEDIAKRKCFLCREHRSSEQIMMKFEGRKGKKYHILINPYPIFRTIWSLRWIATQTSRSGTGISTCSILQGNLRTSAFSIMALHVVRQPLTIIISRELPKD